MAMNLHRPAAVDLKTLAILLAGTLAMMLLPRRVAAEEIEPRLLNQIGVQRGICVVLGDNAANLAHQLATETELTVYFQSPAPTMLLELRQAGEKDGLLGGKLYVEQGDLSQIHLADNLADALVIDPAASVIGESLKRELERVVRPRGKIILRDQTTTVPWPKGMGQWSHPYHGPDNNPMADDRLAKAPLLTRFLAEPYYGPMPEVTVSAGGRLFKAFGHISFKTREWSMLNKLVCINAFNGTQLWSRDLPDGYMIHRNTMIATPDSLYMADNESCKRIDGATGDVFDEITIAAGDGGPGWKWMALDDGVLYALLGEKDPIDTTLRGTRTQSGWPWNGLGRKYAEQEYPWGFGKTLVAIDAATNQLLWRRQWEVPIDSRAVCMKSGRLFIYSHRTFLAAVDAKNGETIWKTADERLLAAIGQHHRAQEPRRGYSSQVYLKCTDDALYFAGPQRRRLVAVSAKDGKMLWDFAEEGNYQLVIRDDGLYAMGRTTPSKKFNPLTGEVLAELDCLRGNCTRATGTVDSIFARGDQHGGTLRLQVADDSPGRIPAMRPACQDGVIAANGLLYWGPWMCDCNHSLVGIISLGPAGDFNFSQSATESERLEPATDAPDQVTNFSITPADWPTYRANNQRTAKSSVSLPPRLRRAWTFTPKQQIQPTAPIAAGGLVFVSGSDGIVRALDAKTGDVRWTAYTEGLVRYPPAAAGGRLFVGSSDGWVYALEAATGRRLWRFRAAPVERKIPVYGKLVSTWPVTSGVLVEGDTAFAAAGIVSHDGTHVYALDVRTGQIRWQNNTSGQLIDRDAVAGVSVQGHLLLNGDRLYMAGGNVVSPAVYDVTSGKCLNTLTDEWQKAPRGSELFLYRDQVRVVDQMMYSPRGYIPSRYYAKYLLEASSGDIVIQGTQTAMARVEFPTPDGKPNLVWKDERFADTAAVAICKNAIVAVGLLGGTSDNEESKSLLVVLSPADGSEIWSQKLPAPAESWGLAIDRDGRIVVTLVDGRVVCFAAS